MPHFVEEEISLRPGQSNDSERPRILHEKAGRAKKSWWKLHKVTVKYKGQNLTIDASEFVPRIKSSERRKKPGG